VLRTAHAHGDAELAELAGKFEKARFASARRPPPEPESSPPPVTGKYVGVLR
jgi:hypothetical protein